MYIFIYGCKFIIFGLVHEGTVMAVDQDLLLVWDEMPVVWTCVIFKRRAH